MGATLAPAAASGIRLDVSSKAGSSVILLEVVQITVRDYQFTLRPGPGYWRVVSRSRSHQCWPGTGLRPLWLLDQNGG